MNPSGLFNINTLKWDEELLEILEIDPGILPSVLPSSGVMAVTSKEVFGAEIPVAGDAGDQHAALFIPIPNSQSPLVSIGTSAGLNARGKSSS